MKHSPHRLRPVASVVLFASLFLHGCTQKPVNEQRYELKGKGVAVEAAKGRVRVEQEEVKGFMAATRMPFPMRDREALKVVEPGDQLQATLVVADDGGYWLRPRLLTQGGTGGAPTPAAG